MENSYIQSRIIEGSVLSISYHSECIVDAPLEMVWPKVLAIKSWMNLYQLETVAGLTDKEGEVVKVVNPDFDESTPKPHHHFYRLNRVVPNQQLVMRVYATEGGSYGLDRMDFYDVISVTVVGQGTKICFDMNGEITSSMMDQDTLEEFGQSIASGTPDKFDIYWGNLKRNISSAD